MVARAGIDRTSFTVTATGLVAGNFVTYCAYLVLQYRVYTELSVVLRNECTVLSYQELKPMDIKSFDQNYFFIDVLRVSPGLFIDVEKRRNRY